MMIRVQLFARARDLAAAEWVEVELRDSATVGDMRVELGRKFPSLESLLKRSAIALDEEFAEDSQLLDLKSKVALLPPVSGGS